VSFLGFAERLREQMLNSEERTDSLEEEYGGLDFPRMGE
jgi:hypothetical protein